MYFCGARMVAMYGTAPVFDSMGLINPIYSYGDTIAISFTCDRAMMPDPDAYADALRHSFAELQAATQHAPVTPIRVRPRPVKKPTAAGRTPAVKQGAA